MTNNRVLVAKKRGERKNRSEVYSGQRLMITSWIATITFFSTRGRCFTKAIAHSKAVSIALVQRVTERMHNGWEVAKIVRFFVFAK